MVTLNAWLEHWEPLWLFLVLATETIIGGFSLYILIKEYRYDEQKDLDKKQRRTKTTKKVTTQPSGESVSEETTETVEPSNENQKA